MTNRRIVPGQTHYGPFHSLFGEMDKIESLLASPQTSKNYPPHNIVRVDESTLRIEVAVAGIDPEAIVVERLPSDNVLRVKYNKPKEIETEDVEYISHGISSRSFDLKFALSPQFVWSVKDAKSHNGILSVVLKGELPLEQRPEIIKINVV